MANSPKIYKKLIRKILQHYLIKSSYSTNPFNYYVYKNSDSDLCMFEKLSINNQIGIYSNLSAFDSRILLFILHSLYEKKYYFFEKDFIQDILHDDDITNEEFGLDLMLENLKNNQIDVENWIRFLELIPFKVDFDDEDLENNSDKLNDYIEQYGTDIDQVKIYKDLPTMIKHYKLKHNQKFYLLQEMINL
jgi:hypothetical protein